VRTTLDLDIDILEAARLVAAQQNQSIGSVISDWAKKGIRSSSGHRKQKGFPVFEVPEAASPITSENVQQLIDDEGLPPGR
jgi:hypothetical protein